MKKSLLTISLIALVGFTFLSFVPGKIGDRLINQEINRVISYIQKSLKDKYWLDDWHLSPEIENIEVFSYQHTAVKRMLRDIEGKGIFGRIKLSEEAKVVFKEVVDNLVGTDKLLAFTILEDAKVTDVENPKLQKTVERLIAKAEKEYEKGLKELEEPPSGKSWWRKYPQEKAITKFSKSWLFSQLAIKLAIKEFRLDKIDLKYLDHDDRNLLKEIDIIK